MNYSNIYQSLKALIIEAALESNQLSERELNSISIEIPKEKAHGDVSTNAAMIIAASLKQKPIDIAKNIVGKLANLDYIENISVAGPGFINFKFKPEFWQKVLSGIINSAIDYGKNNIGEGVRVNIEFVSANPTGPMHIGHSRGAIYGDVLSRVMQYSGYEVVKEYYVNDAGSQIDTLVKSAHLRYREAFGESITIPAGYYPGEYLKVLAEDIKGKFGDRFLGIDRHCEEPSLRRGNPGLNPAQQQSYLELASSQNISAGSSRFAQDDVTITNDDASEFKQIVIDSMLNLIKTDLAELGIYHDIFFSEASLGKTEVNLIEKSVDFLKSKDLVYEGRLERPKGEDDPDWEDREQLLFKSTEFGDDQDRSITKSDGSWTYFAGDIGYAMSKINRGFTRNIIILGADHSGYVKRIKAVYKALSESKASVDVTLCQMVNFIEDGKPIKMSKRAGSFTTVADVIREVGPDILRFIMLTRKNDIILDFDLDLVKTHSKENPVFYVQYAQVRAGSVLKNAAENFPEIYQSFKNKKYNLAMLKTNVELEIIRDLSLFPKIISSCAQTGEIHKIAYYLQAISASFHSLWNLGKEDEEYKFITEDKEVSSARLALVEVVSKVIRIGLQLIGVKPLEKM